MAKKKGDKEGKKENKLEKGKEEPGEKKFDGSLKNAMSAVIGGKKCKECGKSAVNCNC